ncbi:hypothetical protein TREES_T100015842 [Tupaia chinensis]|uniref:Uncharacterized protein n=1 Tax=Tupaia chinensis TaxID=246437 RepID=L9L4K6_TUPCH|nr:hypothetical protein TREES_T100015842 [Tupaia chinensis]
MVPPTALRLHCSCDRGLSPSYWQFWPFQIVPSQGKLPRHIQGYEVMLSRSGYELVPLWSGYELVPLRSGYELVPLWSGYNLVMFRSGYELVPLWSGYNLVMFRGVRAGVVPEWGWKEAARRPSLGLWNIRAPSFAPPLPSSCPVRSSVFSTKGIQGKRKAVNFQTDAVQLGVTLENT